MGGHGAPPEAGENGRGRAPDEEEAREVAKGAKGTVGGVGTALKGEGPVVDQPRDQSVADPLALEGGVGQVGEGVPEL